MYDNTQNKAKWYSLNIIVIQWTHLIIYEGLILLGGMMLIIMGSKNLQLRWKLKALQQLLKLLSKQHYSLKIHPSQQTSKNAVAGDKQVMKFILKFFMKS